MRVERHVKQKKFLSHKETIFLLTQKKKKKRKKKGKKRNLQKVRSPLFITQPYSLHPITRKKKSVKNFKM